MTPKKKKTKRAAKYSRLIIKASTTDRIGSKLLYQYLVEQAKEKGISGATVFRASWDTGQAARSTLPGSGN
jgi:PII-like signaling protein